MPTDEGDPQEQNDPDNEDVPNENNNKGKS
jgi:hypothetical protein